MIGEFSFHEVTEPPREGSLRFGFTCKYCEKFMLLNLMQPHPVLPAVILFLTEVNELMYAHLPDCPNPPEGWENYGK